MAFLACNVWSIVYAYQVEQGRPKKTTWCKKGMELLGKRCMTQKTQENMTNDPLSVMDFFFRRI